MTVIGDAVKAAGLLLGIWKGSGDRYWNLKRVIDLDWPWLAVAVASEWGTGDFECFTSKTVQ